MDDGAAAPQPSATKPLRAVYTFMSPRRKRHLVISLALMLAGAAAELLTIGAVLPFLALLSAPDNAQLLPWLTPLLETLGGGQDRPLVFGAAVLLIIAAIVATILRLLLMWVSQGFALKLGHEIGAEIFARALRQPYADYVNRNSSAVLAGIERVYTVVFAILNPLMQGAVSAFIALCISILLLWVDPLAATLAAASVTGLYVAMTIYARPRLARSSETMRAAVDQRYRTVQEGIGGVRDILLRQSQGVLEDEFWAQGERYRRAFALNLFISSAPRFLLEATGIILIASLAVIISNRTGGLLGAIPVLGVFALGAQRLLPLLQQSFVGWSQFVGNRAALVDIVALLHAPVATTVPRDLRARPVQFEREICFDRVSFGYDAAAPVLRDVALVITKGTRLGIVGETGAGKSTLLDLLTGLLVPDTGRISVDDEPLTDGTRANWQAQIAYVPQTIFLTDRSVAENIALGEAGDTIDMVRVRAAAEAACADGFIARLPGGYAAMPGERGIRLSAGQRQRIGIARALYTDASLLILDEATSALDAQTEARVLQAIRAWLPDLTIVTIAHQTTALVGCDRIVQLADGGLRALD